MVTEGPWLDGLTEAQRAAVVHPATPLLVLAGPGSGKTRVITRRIAHLVAQGAAPWSILALTFTNKAAGEMKERVHAMLEAELAGARGLQVSTFHSFCATLLRRYGSSPAAAASDGTPLAPGFSIFDTDDARDAAKRAIAAAGFDTKNWPPALVLSRISDAKNKLLDAAAYAAEAGDFTSRSLAKIYRAYEAELAKCNAVDFDDLLLRVARLVKQDASVRDELQQRYRHVLIDEYQDTNHAQFVIAGAIAQAHGSLTVVGDPDQSIYAWRGADITNILDFEQHFPGAGVIPLGQNFRSTAHIVAVADGLIRHNTRRKHKDLTTELEAGAMPQVIRALDERHEARVVVDEMVRQHEGGVPWKGMAALYRMNALSRVIEDELRRRSIPYVVVRGTAFYERREIKDALAYLRTLANPSDEVALRRIINVPARGIGATTIARADALAAAHGLRFEAALAATDGLTARARKAIDGFLANVAQWRADLMQGAPHEVDDEDLPQMLGGMLGGYVARVLTESGFEAAAGEGSADAEEAAERRANVAELVTAASEFRMPPQEPGHRDRSSSMCCARSSSASRSWPIPMPSIPRPAPSRSCRCMRPRDWSSPSWPSSPARRGSCPTAECRPIRRSWRKNAGSSSWASRAPSVSSCCRAQPCARCAGSARPRWRASSSRNCLRIAWPGATWPVVHAVPRPIPTHQPGYPIPTNARAGRRACACVTASSAWDRSRPCCAKAASPRSGSRSAPWA